MTSTLTPVRPGLYWQMVGLLWVSLSLSICHCPSSRGVMRFDLPHPLRRIQMCVRVMVSKQSQKKVLMGPTEAQKQLVKTAHIEQNQLFAYVIFERRHVSHEPVDVQPLLEQTFWHRKKRRSPDDPRPFNFEGVPLCVRDLLQELEATSSHATGDVCEPGHQLSRFFLWSLVSHVGSCRSTCVTTDLPALRDTSFSSYIMSFQATPPPNETDFFFFCVCVAGSGLSQHWNSQWRLTWRGRRELVVMRPPMFFDLVVQNLISLWGETITTPSATSLLVYMLAQKYSSSWSGSKQNRARKGSSFDTQHCPICEFMGRYTSF